jgi:MFS family permease
MAAVGSMSPLLFTTFNDPETYNVSYTLLGFLTVVFFAVQLLLDLIFTLFSKHFNVRATVLVTPLLTIAGLLIYAFMPKVFPDLAYLWLVIGTLTFASAAGLTEVLISPVVAAMPSDNPESEMSKLHSSYAWGLVAVVILGSGLLFFLKDAWFVLPLVYTVIPLAAFILFLTSPFPKVDNGQEKTAQNRTRVFSFGLLLCAFCIFLGGASECTMTNWISSYIEKALRIPKLVGDVFGMALFALTLSIGRTLYAKRGKNILRVMLLGMIGAGACYLISGFSGIGVIGVGAAVLTGLCVSMLWPGTIILVGEKFPTAGVAAYALMAAGGDCGASVAPQLMGIIADKFALTPLGMNLAERFAMDAEQIGMRAGMIAAAIFPTVGFFLLLFMRRYFGKNQKNTIHSID